MRIIKYITVLKHFIKITTDMCHPIPKLKLLIKILDLDDTNSLLFYNIF